MSILSLMIFLWIIGLLQASPQISLWHDELLTWSTIDTTSIVEFWKRLIEDQAHPPLFFIVEFIISKFLGYSETSLRLVSIFAMGSAVFFVSWYLIRQKLYVEGLLVALFLLFDPEIIHYSLEARPYGLFILLSCLRFIESLNSNKAKTTTNFIDFALLLTHYYGFFVVATMRLIENDFKIKKIKLELKNVIILIGLMTWMIFIAKDFKQNFAYLDHYWLQDLKYFLGVFDGAKSIFLFLCISTTAYIMTDSDDSKKNLIKRISIFVLGNIFIIGATSFIRPSWSRPYTLYLKVFILMSIVISVFLISEKFFKTRVLSKIVSVLTIFLLMGLAQFNKENQFNVFYKQFYWPYAQTIKIITEQKESGIKGLIVVDSTPLVSSYYLKYKGHSSIKNIDYMSFREDYYKVSQYLELSLHSQLANQYYLLIRTDVEKFDLNLFVKYLGFQSKILWFQDNLALIKYDYEPNLLAD